MKKQAYIKPESIAIVLYNGGRIMAIENSFGADTPFAKETDLGDNWDSAWGFGPEDFTFKNVWEEME